MAKRHKPYTKETCPYKYRIMAAHLAVGRSHRETARIMGMSVATVIKREKDPYVQSLIMANVAELERGIIRTGIIAAFTNFSRDGVVPAKTTPEPSVLSPKRRAQRKKKLAEKGA